MKRYFERRRIARALEPLERESDAALGPKLQREVDAHRRVEVLLRRGAPTAWVSSAGTLRERVLAAIEGDERAVFGHGRGSKPRPSASTRRWTIAAAALVVACAAAWLSLRPRAISPAPEPAPVTRHAVPGLPPKLAALGARLRSKTTQLQQTIDQPLLGEVDKLARDTRSLGRFLRGRLPAFIVRADDDRPWR